MTNPTSSKAPQQIIVSKLLLTGVGIIDLNICSAAIVTKNLDSIEPHSNLPQEL
jgi:hypothetical protein